MSLLQRNATPAEMMYGCVFSENFENKDLIARNGGTITGAPPVFFGADLDGTNDYITYDLSGQEFNSAEIFILFDCTPDFEADDGVFYYFYDTDTRHVLLKNTSDELAVYFNNQLIHAIPYATWGPFWLPGERNVLIVGGQSTDTSAWLNGQSILSNDVTSWQAYSRTTELVIGARVSTYTNKFNGKINKIQIYHSLLTAQEAFDFYTEETYNYPKKAVAHYTMRAREHDPTNVQTLDITKNANHAQFGDGTPPTTPTKNQKRGYLYDGTSDYLYCGADSSLDLTNASYCALVKLNSISGEHQIISKSEATFTTTEFELKVSDTTIKLVATNGVSATTASFSGIGLGVYYLVIGTISGNDLQLYVNGVPGAVAPFFGTRSTTSASTLIGKRAHISSFEFLDGEINEIVVFPFALTPLQAIDLI